MNHVQQPLIFSRPAVLSCQSLLPRRRHRAHNRARATVTALGLVSRDSEPFDCDLRSKHHDSLVEIPKVETTSTFTPVMSLWNRQHGLTGTPDECINIPNRMSEPPTPLLTEERSNEEPREVRYVRASRNS